MSDFFRLDEMGCKDGTPYPSEWADSRWPDLLATLNTIRVAWDGPIKITSGYRSLEYNAKVGGVKTSQHTQGRAADIRPARGNPDELWRVIVELAASGRLPLLGGLGWYPGRFVHVDTRPTPDGRVRRWTGKGAG